MWWLVNGLKCFWTVVMLATGIALFLFFRMDALATLIIVRELIAIALSGVEKLEGEEYDAE